MAADEQALEELTRLALELFPEPVDVFEDKLAARLGLYRHPTLDDAAWRKLRVAVINAAEEAGEIPPDWSPEGPP